jgi:beta-glucanase (GH16 family)
MTPNGRETIGSFVSYYEPGWRNVKHGALFREARQALGEGARWWEEFHVFSVEWTPEHYIFRVDGREYHRETNAVSLAQQYLVLSMLASDHELAELTADELDDTAQVDWVRVYDAASTTSR